jgi:hypothetical protein
MHKNIMIPSRTIRIFEGLSFNSVEIPQYRIRNYYIPRYVLLVGKIDLII